MSNKKYTPAGLPVILKETLDVMRRDVVQRGNQGLDEDETIMMLENPVLFQHINESAPDIAQTSIYWGVRAGLTPKKMLEKAYECGAENTYRDLRRQTEINKLER